MYVRAVACVHDRVYESGQLCARCVASPEALDVVIVVIRIDGRDRVGATLEFMEQDRETAVELFAELGADQARRRRLDRQLREEVEEVDLALVAPAGNHAPHFARDRRRVPAHEFVAQRLFRGRVTWMRCRGGIRGAER